MTEVGNLIDGTSPQRQDAIYAAAATRLPTEFRASYENKLGAQKLSARVPFRATMLGYLAGQSDDSPRRTELTRALTEALQEE
jgi:hypothetical protein